MDEDEASMEIASKTADDMLKQIFQKYKLREWATFRGKHYQLDCGKLSFEGSWNLISDGIRKIRVKYGSMGILLLKTIMKGNGIIDSSDIKRFTNLAIAREVIGPYRFISFFTVNYNVSVYERGYSVTIQDPNFRAIEDRMLCRLHRLTKERFLEIAESQIKIALGKIDVEREAQLIRDHLTLVYAIETRHPLVADRFPHKPVMITPQTYDWIARARRAILEEIKSNTLIFSARLEDKVLSFACSASLMEYFSSSREFIPIGQDALKYAIQLYVEEASMRSQEGFSPGTVLRKIFGEKKEF